MSVAEAVLETGSSVASEGDEAESRSDTDSDMDDVDLTENESSRQQVNERNSVPKLNLASVPPLPISRPIPPSQRTQRSDNNNPGTSTRVDLLSQAFRIKPELLKQATDNKVSLERIIANGFEKALDVHHERLKFYSVEEITSPHKLKTEGNNQHIAVAVNSSNNAGFCLSSLESLVVQNKQAKANIDGCAEKLRISDDRNGLLEFQLAHVKEQLKKSEEENKQLLREIEFLKGNLSRQQSTPSPVSDPLISPRLLPSGGQQSRLSSRMIHLQQLVTDNQQLVSDLSRRVRTQTEIEALLR